MTILAKEYNSSPGPFSRSGFGKVRPSTSKWPTGLTPQFSAMGFAVFRDPIRGRYLTVPNWFLVSLIGSLAAVPWIKWSKRFSLRTLLIATTLVAVLLGAIIYAAK